MGYNVRAINSDVAFLSKVLTSSDFDMMVRDIRRERRWLGS